MCVFFQFDLDTRSQVDSNMPNLDDQLQHDQLGCTPVRVESKTSRYSRAATCDTPWWSRVPLCGLGRLRSPIFHQAEKYHHTTIGLFILLASFGSPKLGEDAQNYGLVLCLCTVR